MSKDNITDCDLLSSQTVPRAYMKRLQGLFLIAGKSFVSEPTLWMKFEGFLEMF